MNNHQKVLETLCRICGGNIVLQHGYRTAKSVLDFCETIAICYGVNVADEDKNVFPKFLCTKCHQKIRRLQKKSGKSDMCAVATFYQHNDNCNICHSKQLASLKLKPLNIKIDCIDRKFVSSGFIKLPNVPAPYRRIFVKQFFNDQSNTLVNEITFTIDINNQWNVLVYEKRPPQNIIDLFPKTLENIDLFVDFLSSHTLCHGIRGYQDIIESRLELKEPFPSIDGKCSIAVIENDAHVALDKKESFVVIRHTDCHLFVINDAVDDNCDTSKDDNDDYHMCSKCKSYISTHLKTQRSRMDIEPEEKKRRTSDSSTVNLKYLCREELVSKLQNAQSKKRELMRKVIKLNSLIEDDIKSKAVSVDGNKHEILESVITSTDVGMDFNEDTPQWLLWQQQKLQASKTNSKGMRWHPLIIRYYYYY